MPVLARRVCGGRLKCLGGGLYFEPTFLADVPRDAQIRCNETFGPIILLETFADEADAVRAANDTHFGLSAAVFGAPQDAGRIARLLNVGAVSINAAGLTAFVHDGEKNSFGQSGLGGSRMGAASIRRFYRKKLLIEAPLSQGAEVFEDHNTHSSMDPFVSENQPQPHAQETSSV